DGALAPVLAEVGPRRVLAAGISFDDTALLVDRHRGEAGDFAIAVDRDAVDVVDQRIGQQRSGEEQRQRCEPPRDHAPTSARWRTSALVSCRPPPIAWTCA